MSFTRHVPATDRSRPVPATSGRLRAGARAGTHLHSGEAMFACLCDPELGGCGASALVSGSALRSGGTRSCGCLRRELLRARCGQHRRSAWEESSRAVFRLAVLESAWRAGEAPRLRDVALRAGVRVGGRLVSALAHLQRQGLVARGAPHERRSLRVTAVPVMQEDPARIVGWVRLGGAP